MAMSPKPRRKDGGRSASVLRMVGMRSAKMKYGNPSMMKARPRAVTNIFQLKSIPSK